MIPRLMLVTAVHQRFKVNRDGKIKIYKIDIYESFHQIVAKQKLQIDFLKTFDGQPSEKFWLL